MLPKTALHHWGMDAMSWTVWHWDICSRSFELWVWTSTSSACFGVFTGDVFFSQHEKFHEVFLTRFENIRKIKCYWSDFSFACSQWALLGVDFLFLFIFLSGCATFERCLLCSASRMHLGHKLHTHYCKSCVKLVQVAKTPRSHASTVQKQVPFPPAHMCSPSPGLHCQSIYLGFLWVFQKLMWRTHNNKYKPGISCLN